ncbi:hypothetical protein MNBD_GAMMA18-734 [hydrothermal vent metagenome]|uniref:HDOD domain-containing protein n=1 Tax=hydrothermal vent metagenome TaxID=652676 RepID=A0A3B0ZBI2_9ZZZZ
MAIYDIDSLISRTTALATPPTTYYQLNSAINNPATSLKDIGDIINQDVSLTAQLLRIANSVFFNFPAQITTVEQAITIVGIQQLRELALACTVLNAFPSIPDSQININHFWQHSLGVGVASRVIAGIRKESNVERYYVLGLLHDLGRIVMCLGDPAASYELLQQAHQSRQLLHHLELERWQIDHGEIGAAFLKNWNLPASIYQPIRDHHHPEKAEEYQDECAIIHVADIIVHALEMGGSGEKRIAPLSDTAWQRLGISPEQLPAIAEEINIQYNKSIELFKSNLHQ